MQYTAQSDYYYRNFNIEMDNTPNNIVINIDCLVSVNWHMRWVPMAHYIKAHVAYKYQLNDKIDRLMPEAYHCITKSYSKHSSR